MAISLPLYDETKHWQWSQFEPYYKELTDRSLTANSVASWLADWSAVSRALDELSTRLQIDIAVNTADTDAEARYNTFLENIFPPMQAAEQALKQKLLDSGLEPEGFSVPLRNIRGEAEIYRDANLPLLTEERKLGTEYDKIRGAQTVMWEGEERTIASLAPLLMDNDRAVREKVWRVTRERYLQDYDALNNIWNQLLKVRQQIADNTGLPSFREYRWKQLLRFDYTPDDCKQFHRAIEEVVVPVYRRILDQHRRRLGVDKLRPWDVQWFGQPFHTPALKPFSEVSQLEQGTSAIFKRVDPKLSNYYEIMLRDKCLDLANRKNKAPGGFCTFLPITKRPFIFMNAVGLHDDIQVLLHESGHAFHAFETAELPYVQQQMVPMEFAEVASMAMELLASPYLAETGFYTEAQVARARIEHLESNISFWVYMAVVDAYQHWVYENVNDASDPKKCDAAWIGLMKRFVPDVDYTGLEAEHMLLRHTQLHIFQIPFYYVEYGLAQLGAMQIWANSLTDQARAVADYQKALALGFTVTLPKLYEAAGAKFTFDPETLRRVVTLAEQVINQLEMVAAN
jgi:oligoendopeptidase F